MTLNIQDVSIAGYRSLQRIRFPVEPLTVFVGANGVGKTNLYRALQLLQGAAAGTLARDLAAEGGMESALWAGERRAKEPVRVVLAVGLGSPRAAVSYSYDIAAGLVPQYQVGMGAAVPTGAAFPLEPQIKSETLTLRGNRRDVVMLERRGPSGFVRDENGKRQEFGTSLLATETALSSLQDAARLPELHLLRQTMLGWRFYHDFRTDHASPLRRPCLAVTTPTLSSDGADLAAAFATLVHIREDTADLDQMIEDAFPGARLVVPVPGRTATFGMIFPEYPKRIFEAAELSDGTLRYLALAGALLSYRLPPFVALNEPEASLHPDLLDPLARLIIRAAKRTQIWLVTHSERLAGALAEHGGVIPRIVVKKDGRTWIEGLRLTGDFGEDE
jgi:predicted ATPase